MRKICLINQDENSNLSSNLFARIARHGKRVLIVDLREHKLRDLKGEDGFDICSSLNSVQNLKHAISILEPNLHIVKGHHNLNYQEFNLFYELFKLDFFDKAFKHIKGYDYLIFEVSPTLNLFTTNAIFYCDELIPVLSLSDKEVDFVNKFARFTYHFNKQYGQQKVISKIIPYYKAEEAGKESYTYLVSEFTSKLISYPILDCEKTRENKEFDKCLTNVAFSLEETERLFDSESSPGERQKVLREYLGLLTETVKEDMPLTSFTVERI